MSHVQERQILEPAAARENSGRFDRTFTYVLRAGAAEKKSYRAQDCLVFILLSFSMPARAGLKLRCELMEYDNREKIGEGEATTERVSERATAAAHRTADKVGTQMKSFADKIRDTGPRVESTIHSTAERLAETLERGSAYFRERQYEGTTQRITAYIRQNPGKSMIVGLAAGLLLALKRRHH